MVFVTTTDFAKFCKGLLQIDSTFDGLKKLFEII